MRNSDLAVVAPRKKHRNTRISEFKFYGHFKFSSVRRGSKLSAIIYISNNLFDNALARMYFLPHSGVLLDRYIHAHYILLSFQPNLVYVVYKERKQGLSTPGRLWPFPDIMMNYAVGMVKNIIYRWKRYVNIFELLVYGVKLNGKRMQTGKPHFIQTVPVKIMITKLLQFKIHVSPLLQWGIYEMQRPT